MVEAHFAGRSDSMNRFWCRAEDAEGLFEPSTALPLLASGYWLLATGFWLPSRLSFAVLRPEHSPTGADVSLGNEGLAIMTCQSKCAVFLNACTCLLILSGGSVHAVSDSRLNHAQPEV